MDFVWIIWGIADEAFFEKRPPGIGSEGRVLFDLAIVGGVGWGE
jgi:hypothetical protein